MEGQNFKTKIHACQTLLKYRNLSQFGFLDQDRNPENLLRMFWEHIQEQLVSQINKNTRHSVQFPQSSAYEQQAYIDQIEKSFMELWSHICYLTQKNLLSPS
mmetsp:Transcript_1875/g.2584  ORF Transcript_1875/g.2584 Transcript_1875/m.2584 type:complete len:102 (-) Transcript_1875:577-882(-)